MSGILGLLMTAQLAASERLDGCKRELESPGLDGSKRQELLDRAHRIITGSFGFFDFNTLLFFAAISGSDTLNLVAGTQALRKTGTDVALVNRVLDYTNPEGRQVPEAVLSKAREKLDNLQRAAAVQAESRKAFQSGTPLLPAPSPTQPLKRRPGA